MSLIEQVTIKTEIDFYPEVEVNYLDHEIEDKFSDNVKQETMSIVIKIEKDDEGDINTPEIPTTSEKKKESRKKYPCPHCTRVFVLESDYDVHQLVHNTDPLVTEQLFTCNDCGEKYPTQVLLDTHKVEHKGSTNGHPCQICGMKLKTKKTLRIHIRNHLTVEPLTCTECGEQFKSQWNFKQHVRLHTVKGLPCPQCDKRFLSKSKLNSHLVSHETTKQFHCKLCDKKFARDNSLKVHMRLHTGKKKDTCKKCEKTFCSAHEATSHMKIHKPKTVKLHKCSGCNLEFQRPALLQEHYISVHTMETPFSCEACDEKFKSKKAWKYHTMTRHAEISFKCELCSREFFIKYLLDRHMKTHSDERPWLCQYCDKAFKLKKTRDVHIGYLHKDKLPVKKAKGTNKIQA